MVVSGGRFQPADVARFIQSLNQAFELRQPGKSTALQKIDCLTTGNGRTRPAAI